MIKIITKKPINISFGSLSFASFSFNKVKIESAKTFNCLVLDRARLLVLKFSAEFTTVLLLVVFIFQIVVI